MSSRTVRTSGAEETEALAAELARDLRPGDVVLLRGEMGAGKTTFVRGAARALGATGPVTSPTFAIGRRYDDATPPVAHLDLHRLVSLQDEDPALLDDYVTPATVAFVEWPELAADALDGVRYAVTLEHVTPTERDVTIRPVAP
ncbi:tRNA (adenosine(37)-N6)-threonylcarbamoyltransferase complex ATPase subunit type 1 TsaE [Conexibacter sp. W3-3-2]|uniref:tRNA (adenosine(37)-N6)-threonylcarbamoyltransferase complex ATPase subunit type 1 TsaE n=1 Tax=Conexibacter sp. W3-3-2 TaxID=2675227 RepID=UPI0012B852BF|nr:tRNA (adenosine(37)-N6)-threonylcarbamoyltransferase complex ATPase subunit type 1 TsaE [Conexibacter sp. W3-3-2]MTD42894.1 tRNA (adenosine(37)-N6)-threonylcarbamoyltransferase complex ATPase subunit type 1 TsaE [Conexibacter sp. W3-3-2]